MAVHASMSLRQQLVQIVPQLLVLRYVKKLVKVIPDHTVEMMTLMIVVKSTILFSNSLVLHSQELMN